MKTKSKNRKNSPRVKSLSKKVVAKTVVVRHTKKKAIKQQIRKRRPIHKKIMLHPITLLLVLLIGVILFEWTYRVVADSITVTAQVPAVALTSPAVITSPTDGFTFNSANIVVNGYCPVNSYVNLYDNNLFSGTSMCTLGGTFQIDMSLYLGKNVLNARPYNFTDQPGPNGTPITLTYTPESVTVSSSKTITPPTNALPILPVVVISTFHYQTFATNSVFTWPIQLQGGAPPITVTITWGNGQTQVIKNPGSSFTISHSFAQQGYYPVIIRAVDANGNVHILQLAALIRSPNSTSIYSTNYHLPTPTPNSIQAFLETTKHWLWIAWPSLGIITLMIVSFWLGERQEFKDALARHRLKPYYRG